MKVTLQSDVFFQNLKKLVIIISLIQDPFNIIEDASARPPHPEMASPAKRLPAFLDGVYLCLIFGEVLLHFASTLAAYYSHDAVHF